MDMDSVGGVFLTLIVGCAVGVIIVICEFCWKRAKVPYGERVRVPAAQRTTHIRRPLKGSRSGETAVSIQSAELT